VEWPFCWVFREKARFLVVILWRSCGGMRGKRGELTVTFAGLKVRQLFQLNFAYFLS
jgi:hypothetical protein